MNTYPIIPNAGVLEFRNRLETAAADRIVDAPELRGALSALTEDDGKVDDFERSASAKVLVSPGFQRVSTSEAKALAEAFVAGTIPAVSDKWTAGLKEQFERSFVRSEDGAWIHLPAEARVVERGSLPPEVAAAVDRYENPTAAREDGVAAYRIDHDGVELFAVHSQQQGAEQLSLYDAQGTLLTWGCADQDGGFFWED